ncbi:RyR domain-containing protein [Nocardioides cynanchi]|uniref:RyR domain-containing protein n=1 Tax=Nocardioides cynanchi TaxID=2558918 RepID=UPI00124879CB|nr:RyR domain-containing protein [Nocardioides cynanchi]
MERLNRFTAIAAGVLILVSLLFGYVGFLTLGPAPHPKSDAAFAALQLFALDAPPHIASRSSMLNVARFSAPLSLVLATVATIVALLGQRFRRFSLRWRGHHHVILIGIDATSFELGQCLLRRRGTVVAVDTEEHPQLIALQSGGATTLVGDARESRLLGRCRVKTARHVVVIGKSDTHTLQLCEALAGVLGPRSAATVHAAIHDESLWRQLGRVEIRQSRPAPRMEFFNPADRRAKAYLQLVTHELDGELPEQFWVAADGLLGRRMLVNLCQQLALGGRLVQVQVESDTHEKLIEPLLRDERWIGSMMRVRVAEAGEATGIALVCSERSDGRPLGRALELAQDSTTERVFLCAAGHEGDTVLDLKRLSPRVSLLPADSEWLRPSHFFGRSWIEIMAEARHEDYYANEVARGSTRASNRSLVPWRDLPESLRESNRAFARAVGAVLEQLGGTLAPLRGPVLEVSLPDDELELLARNEHDRWMCALTDDNWTYAPAPKDPHLKTHPLLVDWEKLDEPEREKDRDAIRAIPRMLARVGYSLEIPARSDTH